MHTMKKTDADKQAELNRMIDWVWEIAIKSKDEGEAFDAEKEIASLRLHLARAMGITPTS